MSDLDLANRNAQAAGLAPPGPAAGLGARVRAHLLPRPVVRANSPTTAHHLVRPDGVADRPQSMDVGYYTRPWQWFARLTGAHGVVGEAPAVPNMTGGQHAWPNYSRRTFRQAPVVPWDEADHA